MRNSASPKDVEMELFDKKAGFSNISFQCRKYFSQVKGQSKMKFSSDIKTGLLDISFQCIKHFSQEKS